MYLSQENLAFYLLKVLSFTAFIELYFKIIIYVPVKKTLFVCLFVENTFDVVAYSQMDSRPYYG